MADNGALVDDLRKQIEELKAKDAAGWMSDVQRTLALLLVGTFTLMIVLFAARIMVSGELTLIGALLKELKDALNQMVMMALGFFLGNTMAKMAQDKASQNVVEKLTGPTPPGGPVTPIPVTPVVAPVPWWNQLTEAERKAITDAAAADPGDTRLASIASGPVVVKLMPDDMAYLVAKGLLTQERATAIQGT